MRTWLKAHPNAGFVLCMAMVLISSLNLRWADSNLARGWSIACMVTFSAWAVYWWDRT